MKTRTLHALVQSFDEEARYLEAAVLLAREQWQEDFLTQRVNRTAGIVAAIGHEILARGQSVNRDAAESQRFDDWLQRALEAHLDLDPENGVEDQRNVAGAPPPFMFHGAGQLAAPNH